MNEYASENEQWEAIKEWLKKNGLQIAAVFILSLSIGLIWRYWGDHQLTKRNHASQLFDQLLSVQLSHPASTLVSQIAEDLGEHYLGTPYASLSALFEAKNAIANHDLALAEKKLAWAVEHATSDDIRQIAKLRLARVLLAQKKSDQALVLLEKKASDGYSAAIEQIKGDIYLAEGKVDKARAAYQKALNAAPDSATLKKYIQMQLYQLPAQ